MSRGGSVVERGAHQHVGGRAVERLLGHHAVEREAVLLGRLVDRRLDVARVDRRHVDLVAVLEPQGVGVGRRSRAWRSCRRSRTARSGRPARRTTLTTRPRPGDSSSAGSAARRHPPGREQVDLEHLERRLVGRLAGALREAEPGVVDQHVEPAEPLDRLGHGAGDRVGVGHVAGQRCRGPGRPRGRCRRPARRARAASRRPRAPMPPAAPVIRTRLLMRCTSSRSRGALAAARRTPRRTSPCFWRKRNVQSGQSVTLRPCSSTYQLEQPVFQTVPSSFSCTLLVVGVLGLLADLGRRRAAARPSRAARRGCRRSATRPCRPSTSARGRCSARASGTCSGSPRPRMPLWACGLPSQDSRSVLPRRRSGRARDEGISVTWKPVEKISASTSRYGAVLEVIELGPDLLDARGDQLDVVLGERRIPLVRRQDPLAADRVVGRRLLDQLGVVRRAAGACAAWRSARRASSASGCLTKPSTSVSRAA